MRFKHKGPDRIKRSNPLCFAEIKPHFILLANTF